MLRLRSTLSIFLAIAQLYTTTSLSAPESIDVQIRRRVSAAEASCLVPVLDDSTQDRERLQQCKSQAKRDVIRSVMIEQVDDAKAFLCRISTAASCESFQGALPHQPTQEVTCASLCQATISQSLPVDQFKGCQKNQLCAQESTDGASGARAQENSFRASFQTCFETSQSELKKYAGALPGRALRALDIVEHFRSVRRASGELSYAVARGARNAANQTLNSTLHDTVVKSATAVVEPISKTILSSEAWLQEMSARTHAFARMYSVCFSAEQMTQMACNLGTQASLSFLENAVLGSASARAGKFIQDLYRDQIKISDIIMASLAREQSRPDATTASAARSGVAREAIEAPSGRRLSTALQAERAAYQYPLSPEHIQRLENHPLTRELREKYGNNPDLRIAINGYDPRFEAGATEPLRSGMGEATQAIFIKRNLEVIFPNAKFQGTSTQPPPSLRLSLLDSAEDGDTISFRNGLEMSVVKAANSGARLSSGERNEWRSMMGFASTDNVVSLQTSMYTNVPDIAPLARNAFDAGSDVVMVSKGGAVPSAAALGRNLKNDEILVANLSEYDPSTRKPGQRVLLINDTAGRMHIVNAVADRAVIAGAVNLFEPLNQRTPTVFFSANSTRLGNYNPDAFNQMARVARASGGAAEVNTPEQMAEKLREFRSNPPRVESPPAYAPLEDGRNALDNFMRNLSEHMATRASGR